MLLHRIVPVVVSRVRRSVFGVLYHTYLRGGQFFQIPNCIVFVALDAHFFPQTIVQHHFNHIIIINIYLEPWIGSPKQLLTMDDVVYSTV